MKKSFYLLIFVFAAALSLYVGCSEDVTPSLYQEPDPKAAPVVSSIEPAGTALAGVSVVTINGSNFSADPSKVAVYFNSSP